jgi:hypothetical protein
MFFVHQQVSKDFKYKDEFDLVGFTLSDIS